MNWDFALILFVLLVITGVVWATDYFYLRARRRRRAEAEMAVYDAAPTGVGSIEAARLRQAAYDKAHRVPWFIEYCVSFFPVILFVFVLRSFIVEPFRIPSGSMLPTLQNGDLILVNKYEYGIRLPVVDKKVVELGSPQRGDVVVFRYPVDPNIDYIKRVVGLPGDEVVYQNKTLFINGQEVPLVRDGDYYEPDRSAYISQFIEKLGAKDHKILLNKRAYQDLSAISDYPYRDQCGYFPGGMRCVVPEGHYFMMGDNRDNSLDSRYWGFVPDENIVGRAFFIWMNFGDLARIGRFN
ncbi:MULTISPECIES: signal peptidase I [unclassified Pusillimonas]|uniref:signal peptidase I n=1 Tax=unclassified Pusillimonas TaxID=2640016 RepID=UPI000B9D1B00|nr:MULTISPECIES: signal peptidase I [unclassified Pusillimonas]OXR50375.1 signal peptidase I [Pusillimonas sp. T2]ROT44655.1 signal peptidase I [Pusillimonas sp. NJUB218]